MGRGNRSRIRYEYELRDILRSCGFYAVRLPASGRGYHFDVLAYKYPYLYLIEVKSSSRGVFRLSEDQKAEIERLASGAQAGICIAVAKRHVGKGRGGWEVEFVLCTEGAREAFVSCPIFQGG